MNDSESWGLAVAFDTDEPEFSRGVEIGMLYERVRNEQRPVRAVVRARNAEMALRIADATGTRVTAQDLNADWLEVTYTEISSESPGSAPR